MCSVFRQVFRTQCPGNHVLRTDVCGHVSVAAVRASSSFCHIDGSSSFSTGIFDAVIVAAVRVHSSFSQNDWSSLLIICMVWMVCCRRENLCMSTQVWVQ